MKLSPSLLKKNLLTLPLGSMFYMPNVLAETSTFQFNNGPIHSYNGSNESVLLEGMNERINSKKSNVFVATVNHDLRNYDYINFYLCAADNSDSQNVMQNNSITLTMGANGKIGKVITAYNYKNNITTSKNNLTIKGNDSGHINLATAGFSEEIGNVTYNTTIIENGSLSSAAGGVAYKGNAQNNKTTVTGGVITGGTNGIKIGIDDNYDYWGYGVYGGLVAYGDAISNTAEMTDGIVFNLYGGLSNFGNATKNIAKMSGGLVQSIIGGQAENNGNATENNATVNGGKVEMDAIGGVVENGTASNNKVTIKGGNVERAIGGSATTFINKNGRTTGGNGTAKLNTAIADGTNANIAALIGGYSELGKAEQNTATITNGTVKNVIGGCTYSGIASANKVEVKGGIVTGGSVVLELDFSNFSLTGTINKISIPGEGIYGGLSINGNIQNNSVSVHDVTLGCNIYGGYAFESGNIQNNTIFINNVTFNNNGEQIIAGGYSENGNVSGNSLKIGAKGFTVKETTIAGIGNFDAISTDNGATITNKGRLMFANCGNNITLNAKISGGGKTDFNTNMTVNGLVETEMTVAASKTLTISANNIGNNVSNQGTILLGEGNLKKNITENGTTKLNGNIKVTDNININGTLNGNGKTIDMQDGAIKTLNIGTLTGNSFIKLDADLETNTSDKIVTTNGSGANITLNGLKLIKDSTNENGTLSNVFGNVHNVTLTNNTIYTTGYKYIFNYSGGSLNYTRSVSTKGLSDYINGNMDNLSVTKDTTISEAGIIGTVKSGHNVELPLNGYDLTGIGNDGIVINQGGTFTANGKEEDLSKISGFKSAFINNGTLNLQNIELSGNTQGTENNNTLNISGKNTIKNNISGKGNMNIQNGETTVDNANIANTVNIANTAKLTVQNSANVSGNVNNAGTYTLNTNANNSINNNGTFEIQGNNKFSGSLNNNKDGIVIANTGENLNASVTNNGNIKITNGGTITKNINGNGTLTFGDTTTIKNAVITQNKMEIESGAENKLINIGDSTSKGVASVENTVLNGGKLFLDPAWVNGVGIEGASNYATNTTNLDGQYIVGQNSILSFGTTDYNDVINYVQRKNSNITWGETATSGVYLAKTVDLTNGAIYADGSLTSASVTPPNGSLTLKDKSMLMVNTRTLTNNTALTGVSSAEISNNAVIYLRGARTGQDIYITDGGAGGCSASDITLSGLGKNFQAEATLDGDKLKIHIIKGSLAILEDTIIPHVGEELEMSSNNKLQNFLDNISNCTNDSDAIEAINALANIGELGATNHSAYTMSNQMTDMVTKHLREMSEEDKKERDIWASYIHNKEKASNLKLGGMNANYDAKYNGIIVGTDLSYRKNNTVGMALSYTNGDISNGGVTRTQNDATYYGLSLYNKVKGQEESWISDIIYDINYLHSKGDITQHNNGAEITAKPENDIFSLGIRMTFGKDYLKPYIGARYMTLGTKDYKNNFGMKYDVDEQHIFMVPIGLTYNKTFEKDNWTYKPFFESGYVFNKGKKDTDQTISYNGTKDIFSFNVIDSNYWFAKIGLGIDNEKITYGLNYQYLKSSHFKDNKFMLDFVWKF